MTRDYIFGAFALLACAGLSVELGWYGIPDATAQQAPVQVPERKPPVPAPRKCHVEISRAKNGKIVIVMDSYCDLDAFEQGVALEWGKVKP